MAIAGIFVMHSPRNQQSLLDSLGGMPQIVEMKVVGTEKLAATLELPGEELTGLLKKISAMPEIIDLELVFVNYEDDLDENGFMKMPAEAKKYE